MNGRAVHEPESARTNPARHSRRGRLKKVANQVAAFSLHLVKTGRVFVELGRALNRADEIRLIAEYKGDPAESEQAVWTVEQAECFVQAMGETFLNTSSSIESQG